MTTSENPIKLFVATFQGTYQKLAPTDVDYKILDRTGKHIAYAIVSCMLSNTKTGRMSSSYPLKVEAKRLVKLMDKRFPGVIIWACADGIIYGKLTEIEGAIQWDGTELICSFDKQKTLKYIRYD